MLWVPLLITIVLTICCQSWVPVKCDDLSLEYFEDAIIACKSINRLHRDDHVCNSTHDAPGGRDCDDTRHVVKLLWLLPNGATLQDGNRTVTKRLTLTSTENGSSVTVTRIDDVDFGYYTCIYVWNDFNVTVVRHSLNIDGASIETFLQRQKEGAITGAIAAGVFLAVLVVMYLVWRFTCSERVKRKRRLTGDLAKGINRYSTEFYDNVGFEHYVKRSDT